MNLFVLDRSPFTSAIMHCDKHVVKMIVETAQLLSTAHHVLDGTEAPEGLYKVTHANHPSAKWIRKSNNNYTWTWCLFGALLSEYSLRYGKVHACQRLLDVLHDHPRNIEVGYLTPFAQCMPDVYKQEDAVAAYRAFYIGEKARFARWTKREKPEWWPL